MKSISTLFLLVLFFTVQCSNNDTVAVSKRKNYCNEVIGVYHQKYNMNTNFIFDSSIVKLCCDTLPQVVFWERVLQLPSDSGVINISTNRKIVHQIPSGWWKKQNDDFKVCYRDSIRQLHCLNDSVRIYFTEGKGGYYAWDSIFFIIDKAINVFMEYNTDPWYAQAILMIESPTGNLRSNVGARGYFQLMKNVAKKFGLTVTRHHDDRLNFEKSAMAAAMLLRTICIPEAKKILDTLHIPYNESELWFKLLVMHVYHAGAYNVKRVVEKSGIKEGNMNLIYGLWQTRAGAFQSASQNYSQLVLTAFVKSYKQLGLLQCVRPKQ